MTLLRTRNGAGSRVLFLFLALALGMGSLSAQTVRYRGSVASRPQTLTPALTGEKAETSFRLAGRPVFALKTNLVYAATLTPNLGIEIGLGRRTSLEISGGYHPWGKDPKELEDGTMSDEKKLKHWLVKPEFRYWLSNRFDGHYFGVQGIYTDFDIHGYKIPELLKKDPWNDGYAVGGGLTYGYHWAWSKHWGMEFNVGVGVLHLDYKEKTCDNCTEEAIRYKKTYFGPTSAGVKVVFIIQ